MNKLEKNLLKKPLTSALTIVLICIIAIVYIHPIFLSVEDQFNKDIAHSIIQLMLSGLVFAIVYKCGWIEEIGLTEKYKNWPKKWWVATIPMSLLALINLISIDSSLIVFDIEKLTRLIFVNFTTGFFEELLLRGFCFYLLFKAWEHKPNGLFKAAIAQAVIFGLAHLINLTIASPLDVISQVIYATLFGIGFAGLIAFTRSLWLPIWIHTLINTASGFGFYFIPDVVIEPTNLGTYIVGIIAISLFCAIPGLFLLRSANRKVANKNQDKPPTYS
jgi:membrane protease YdiL (CAAX protease family)